MNTKYLIAIAVAAVVVVALIVVVPGLDSGGSEAADTTSGNGQDAPAISEGDTMPADHPDVDEGSSGTGTDSTVNAGLQEAIAAAEEEYENNSGNVDAVNALADLYMQANRMEEALGLYEEALELDSGSVAANVGVAMIDLAEGDEGTALTRMEEIVEDNPDSQLAHYSLAVAYFSTDDREAAQAEWEKTVSIDSTSELGELAQQFIDLMQGGDSSDNPHGG